MSDIYLSLTETPTVVTLSQPVVSGALAGSVTVTNVVSVSVLTMPAITVSGGLTNAELRASAVTVALDANSLSALEQVTVTVGAAVTVAGFSTSSLPPSTVTVANTVTINGTVTANGIAVDTINPSYHYPIPLADSGEAVIVDVRGGFGQPNVPISGTVTANVVGYDSQNQENLPIGLISYGGGGSLRGVTEVIGPDGNPLPISGTVTIGNSVTIGSLPAISGTVTANNALLTANTGASQQGGSAAFGISGADVNAIRAVIYSSANATFSDDAGAPVDSSNPLPISGTVTIGNSVTISSLPAISGTVTANVSSTTVTVRSFPRPTWTDYSGSVVSANSAVTAVSTVTRSYLLAQVTTGQMFLNIGATCTTGNGVYFSAGQGFAWETSVPQGIVSIISSVTGTNYVLKDG